MVHALEEIHGLLKPDGCLIEIHPIPETPLIQVYHGSTVLRSGLYPGYDYEEDLWQAENALKQIVQRGLFLIERSTEFDFQTHGSSITELQDFWAEPAAARESELALPKSKNICKLLEKEPTSLCTKGFASVD